MSVMSCTSASNGCGRPPRRFETAPSELDGALDISAPIDRERVDVRCVLKASAVRPCDRCGNVTLSVDVDSLLLYFPEEV